MFTEGNKTYCDDISIVLVFLSFQKYIDLIEKGYGKSLWRKYMK